MRPSPSEADEICQGYVAGATLVKAPFIYKLYYCTGLMSDAFLLFDNSQQPCWSTVQIILVTAKPCRGFVIFSEAEVTDRLA